MCCGCLLSHRHHTSCTNLSPLLSSSLLHLLTPLISLLHSYLSLSSSTPSSPNRSYCQPLFSLIHRGTYLLSSVLLQTFFYNDTSETGRPGIEVRKEIERRGEGRRCCTCRVRGTKEGDEKGETLGGTGLFTYLILPPLSSHLCICTPVYNLIFSW